MSAGLPVDSTAPTASEVAAILQAQIWVGGGWQEPVHAQGYLGFDGGTVQEVQTLIDDGIRHVAVMAGPARLGRGSRSLLRSDESPRGAFSRRLRQVTSQVS